MSERPIYAYIEEYLLEQINERKYLPGDKIPSERELAKILKVNRMSVKRAISNLIKSGYLVTYPGKATYVKKYNTKLSLGNPNTVSKNGMNELVRLTGMTPHNKVTESSVIKSDKILAEIFSCKLGCPLYSLGRIRYSDKDIYAFEFTIVPHTVFPNITNINFETNSLYQYMDEQGHKPVSLQRELEIVQANDIVARYLDISPNSLVYFFTFIGKDANGIIVEYTKSYMNMNQVIFSTQPR